MTRRKRLILSIGTFVTLSVALPTFGSASFLIAFQDSDMNLCSSQPPLSSSPLSATVLCNFTGGGIFSSANGELFASADHTALGGSVKWDSVTNLSGSIGPSPGVGAFIIASSNDMITVTGAVGSGTLRITYVLTGTRTAGPRTIASARLDSGGMLLNDAGTLVIDVPFTFGVAMALQATLRVAVLSDGLPLPPGTPIIGTSDYSNTAALQPFFVLDSLGQFVPGANVSSDTFSYAVVSEVPEPYTGGATGMVLLLTMIGVRRQRCQSERAE